MGSIILRSASPVLLALLVLLSLFVLFRGHNDPGGGFIGGLLIAAGFALYELANGPSTSRRILRVDPRTLIGAGLLAAIGSGLVGTLLEGRIFLTGVWTKISLPGVGKVSSVLLFDVGVYLVVLGASLLILLTLAEE